MPVAMDCNGTHKGEWGYFNSADLCRANGDKKFSEIFEWIKKSKI
jgi:hypothetical protein